MSATHLLESLPTVRGRYLAGAPLAKFTWFRVGGPADVLFQPADVDDLLAFLRARPRNVPVTVIGVGSNLLVRDGGVPGVVIRLGRGFAGIDADAVGATVVAGGGALDANVAKAACAAAIAGLEFLSGVPGTIGGALRMNAGAFGGNMDDVVSRAEAVDLEGRRHVLTRADLGFVYRGAAVPHDWIFVGAVLRGRPGDPAAIAARMADIRRERDLTQPIRTRTGGSTFKNPGHPAGEPRAWQLVDRAGCRGLRIGAAEVSTKHCNFLVNTGGATASEIEALGEEVRRRVAADSGVRLEWEIERIGRAAERATAGAAA